ncbi:MAG: hypothetical protein KY443_01350 [Actinobacteria bacterium]|nr:hypothetical protein [Actinomycetota bacterium]
MRRRPVLVLMAGALGLVPLSGCGGPQPDLSVCEKPPTELVESVAARMADGGTLRHARMVRSEDSGRVFVSAELHRDDDRWWAKGDLLTWMADEAGGFYAVDEHAREQSGWPEADFTLREDRDAVESRGCTLTVQGTIDVDRYDIDCPPGGVARRECLDDALDALQDRLDREYEERRRRAD